MLSASLSRSSLITTRAPGKNKNVRINFDPDYPEINNRLGDLFRFAFIRLLPVTIVAVTITALQNIFSVM